MSYGVMFTMLDDYRDTYGITESKLGLIVAAGFITGFLANVIIAPYADKGHAKKLVILGIVLEIIGCLTMAFGGSFLAFLLGRFLTGLGSGSSEPAVRRIIILANPENMGRNLGLSVSAGVGGFALGPVISAATVDYFGLAAPFLIICALLILVFIGITRLSVNEADAADAPPVTMVNCRWYFSKLIVASNTFCPTCIMMPPMAPSPATFFNVLNCADIFPTAALAEMTARFSPP